MIMWFSATASGVDVACRLPLFPFAMLFKAFAENESTRPNHALQQTRPSRSDCNHEPRMVESLNFGSSGQNATFFASLTLCSSRRWP
jgi:hypothetical protein